MKNTCDVTKQQMVEIEKQNQEKSKLLEQLEKQL